MSGSLRLSVQPPVSTSCGTTSPERMPLSNCPYYRRKNLKFGLQAMSAAPTDPSARRTPSDLRKARTGPCGGECERHQRRRLSRTAVLPLRSGYTDRIVGDLARLELTRGRRTHRYGSPYTLPSRVVFLRTMSKNSG